jgi:hypothetical protein
MLALFSEDAYLPPSFCPTFAVSAASSRGVFDLLNVFLVPLFLMSGFAFFIRRRDRPMIAYDYLTEQVINTK